jgi:hypothetical protein
LFREKLEINAATTTAIVAQDLHVIGWSRSASNCITPDAGAIPGRHNRNANSTLGWFGAIDPAATG